VVFFTRNNRSARGSTSASLPAMRSSAAIGRRQLLLGLGAGGVCLGYSGWVQGSTAIPITLSALVARSRHILVGIARKGEAIWEMTDAGRRIVTYREVAIEQTLDGRPPAERTLVIRTLGGSVGDIGQIVHGEAELEPGRTSVLFLREHVAGLFSVTAMAQGHYPLVTDPQGLTRMVASPKLAEFAVEPSKAAFTRLRGSTLGECERMISEELAR
jgi:hypothetical protein